MNTEEYNEIAAFVRLNQDDVIIKIGDATDYYTDSERNCTFCPDGILEIIDIDECDDHLYEVIAKAKIEESKPINTQDGLFPNTETYDFTFRFFVDEDENGELVLAFCLDESGKVDLGASQVLPED